MTDIGNEKPWKFNKIIEKDFLEKADTGDILLFQSNNKSGPLIRKFTSSEYDHVAMVIR